MGPTFSIMVVKVRGAAHPLLVAARSESGASRRLRPGGGAFAFEQLQDAVRVLPDRADVAASGRTGIAFAGQTIMITLGAAGGLWNSNVLPVYVDGLTATP
jgi:hypothetical protein